MAKSKASQVVALTKTVKKNRDAKYRLVEKVSQTVSSFRFIHFIQLQHARNQHLSCLRELAEQSQSRVLFGKWRLLVRALNECRGSDVFASTAKSLKTPSNVTVALWCTNESLDKVQSAFASLTVPTVPRMGHLPKETLTVPAGPLTVSGEPVPHPMEPRLRQLGLPTCLVQGVITLRHEAILCQAGEPLTVHQAQLCKVFHHYLTSFKVISRVLLDVKKGNVELLQVDEDLE